MNITNRIDMNLGYSCNIRCRFCYYQDTVTQKGGNKDLTTAQARYWLKYFRDHGKTEVDLTGGEPTIRPDIFELASYCREIGYTQVAVITNGLRMADRAFTEKLLAAGVNDVLFSIHGPTAEIHDSLTKMPGSYEKITAAVRHVKELSAAYPVRMRSNSVVNGVSYRVVDQTARLMQSLGIRTINFIMFNPIVQAQGSDADMNVSYRQAAPHLMKMIDEMKHSFDRITVRYMPFCCMPGYEAHITNTAQIQYDPDEWDYYLRTRFRNGFWLWLGALGAGFLLHPNKSRFLKIGWLRSSRESIKYALAAWNKKKGPQCRTCRNRHVCDGLWREYAAHAGFDELTAMPGSVIPEPDHYLREQFGS